MKKVIFSLIFATSCTMAMAQQNGMPARGGRESSSGSDDEMKMTWTIGAQLGLPLGDFGTGNSLGFNGFIEAGKPFSGNVIGFANLGYSRFLGKSVDDGYGDSESAPSVGIVTVLAGAKYRLDKVDIGAGVGYGSASGGDGSSGGFLFSPVATYNFSKLSVRAAYNTLSVSGGSLSWFSAGLAYKF